MSRCIIIGGGENVRIPEISSDTFIIAADSGYNNMVKLGVIPNALVGDMDSINGQLPSDIEVIKAPCEKDDTDTMLAVKIGFERGYKDFLLTGVTGGRRGHTAAAIWTLEYIYEHGGEGCIWDMENEIYFQGKCKKNYKREENIKYISVFSVSAKSRLSMRGLKYGGEDMLLLRSNPIGVSNEFASDFGEIQVNEGKILVILEY